MSKKDYKKGMADAMEAYEAFGEKQEAAIRHVGREVEKTAQKVDKLGSKIGEITDYITDQEKAALYKLNTPVDIADLDDAEKRILLAVLYQLSADADELTEGQQNYLRAVQQYLKIYNPQTEIDLEAVENIEDISAQKAVLQTVLEFFRLGANPDELTEEQEDFLDCFQVNRRTRREISGHISAIVEAVGVKGLSEKYGFVAAQPRSEFARYKDNGTIPGDVADLCVSYRRNDYSRFQNGEFVLETRDYLVMCKAPLYRDWTAIENGGELQKYGFFRIDKHSGKVTRIDIDYKKDFSFETAYDLSFCIQGNTIYFIENCVNWDKHSEVPLVAIDFEKCSFYKRDDGSYTLRGILSADDGASPITLSEDMAICYTKFRDEQTSTLMRCDLQTGEQTYPDKGGQTYMLLGDYLYKFGDNSWYKTNISQGWDNLQWELVQFQD